MKRLLEELSAGSPATSLKTLTDDQLVSLIQAHRLCGVDLLHDRYDSLLKMTGTITDEQLMVMIQVHCRSGLDLLHNRYFILLKIVSMKVLHNEADAEDLLQDVFMEIWERADSYNPQMGRPLSWLTTLARRRAIDRLRKRETHNRAEERFAEEVHSSGNGWTHIHEELSQHERSIELKRALSTLPEPQRDVIELAFYGEMTQREIALRTGIPLGTIKTRLELGLKKMAVCLSGFEDFDSVGKSGRQRADITSQDTTRAGSQPDGILK